MSEPLFLFHKIDGAPSFVYLRVPTRDGHVDHGLTKEEAWRLLAELQAILEPCEPINFSELSGGD